MFYENLGENGVWTRHHSINDTLVKLVDLLTFFPLRFWLKKSHEDTWGDFLILMIFQDGHYHDLKKNMS